MNAMKLAIIFILIFALCSCDIIPIDFNFDANIQTTSELGQDTLDRVDAVNETLATGLEVGPETRGTIEELNQSIANGIKGGFDDETLARVDELLRIVEDGLKIGLDSETLDSLDSITETIDQMPGQWETSGSEIIRTLEGSAGSAAKKMANEIKSVMDEATINYQQMTAVTGTEFRCNVDYLGSKAGSTVQEFIGNSLVGKIKGDTIQRGCERGENSNSLGLPNHTEFYRSYPGRGESSIRRRGGLPNRIQFCTGKHPASCYSG